MRILLVQSFSGYGIVPVFPLGLSYLARALEHHEVKVFDPNIEENHLEKLEGLIKQFNPEIVGISLRNIWPFEDRQSKGLYYNKALDPILKLIKWCGNQKIVIGGAGFTAYADEVIEYSPEIDYGVFREGEETFVQLLENLDHPEIVKGVFYRKQGKVYFTGEREFGNFDSLPMPKRDIFNIDKYKDFPYNIGVQTKRGCALKCAYCVYPYLCGYKVSLRSPEKVVDEIEYLSNSYGIKSVTFVDTIFNTPKGHAEQICHELLQKKLDIKWTAWFHPKYITEEFMKLAIKSGCYLFELSPDAYSDKMLSLLQKNMTKSDIVGIYKLAKRVEGANVSFNFFVNGPGENIFTFLQLLLFYVRVKIFLGPKLKRFFFSHLHIEPNTDLYRLALEKGLIDQSTKVLGSQEIYDKMLYRNSILIDKLFKLLWRTKRIIISLLQNIEFKRHEKEN